MKLSEFNWGNGLFLIIYPILTFISLPLLLIFRTPGWGIVISALAIFVICQLSLTAGYHRYFAHKAFQSSKLMEYFFLFFGTLSIQNSVLQWSYDHRNHHAFVDTEKDPYSITRGFWHAHFLWMVKKGKTPDFANVRDLLKNPLLRFQHTYYLPLAILSNLVVVLLFGWLFQDYIGSFVLVFLVRLFVSHHSTFSVNSLAHYYGSQPYSTEHTAVDNWLVALLTMGEGYHNYHHTFASDYRNGICWYQWDPTKIFIWVSNKVGLVSGLKRINYFSIKKKLVLQDRQLLIEKVKQIAYVKREFLIGEIEKINAKLQDHIANMHALRLKYESLKAQRASRLERKQLKQQLKHHHTYWKRDYRTWNRMTSRILRYKPIVE